MNIGGLDINNGKILSLAIESVTTAPEFTASNAGKFVFSSDDGVLRFNNGVSSYALNVSVSENPNLIRSLQGNEVATQWLNDDLSFNNAPFDELPNIVDSSSLFNVIEQLANKLDVLSTVKFSAIDLSEETTVEINDIVIYDENHELAFSTFTTAFNESNITLRFNKLDNFNNDIELTTGNMLFFQDTGGDENQLVSMPVSHVYYGGANDDHEIYHDLGRRYVSVLVVNTETDKQIPPNEYSLYYNVKNDGGKYGVTIVCDILQPIHVFITNFAGVDPV